MYIITLALVFTSRKGKRLNLFTKKGRNILIFLIKYWLQNLVKIRTLSMGGRVLIDNICK
jgi:hypothetical protein